MASAVSGPNRPTPRPKIAVIVATLGRPSNVEGLLGRLESQTLTPTEVLLSGVTENDLPARRTYAFPVRRILGERGSSRQRNAALALVEPDTDIVVFYDDDYVPSRSALESLATFLERNADVTGVDGRVLADGIRGPGLTFDAAVRTVDTYDLGADNHNSPSVEGRKDLYGCNMAFRFKAIKGMRFNEDFPLYGWLEDVEFSARVDGRLVRLGSFAGVHCGEKRGRESNGRPLGYSQVANPVYLARAGLVTKRRATAEILRCAGTNHLRAIRPEPWIDRPGRVSGNWAAVRDSLRGRLDPRNARQI